MEEVCSMGARTGRVLCDRCDHKNPLGENYCLRCGEELQLPGNEALAVLERAREALRAARALWGESHPRVVDALTELAEAERRFGMAADAEEHVRKAVELAREITDGRDSALPRALVLLGRILLQTGDAKAAVKNVRESVELLQAGGNGDAVLLAEAESILGWCLTERGCAAEAEPLLIRSFETLRAEIGEDDQRTLRAINSIIDTYVALHRHARATKYRAMLSACSR